MTSKIRAFAIAATLAVSSTLVASAASAVTLLDAPASTGQISDSGPANYTFSGGAGPASLTFNLEGYISLDGDGNGFTDTFQAMLNGTTFLSGAFDLGGGGSNVLFTSPAGTTFTVTPVGNGSPTFGGGLASFSTTLNLIEGLNTLSFSFIGPLQGAGDEGWGINSVLVDGNAVAAVPEPATWAMMILGFGLVGATLRYRRRSTKVAFAIA